MNVFVFKPSNELIGKFPVESSADIRRALDQFLKNHVTIPECSYAEVDGKTWTITNRAPLTLESGRLSSATLKKKSEEAEIRRVARAENITSQLKDPLAILLAQHFERNVHINYYGPDSFDTANLVQVTDTYFSVQLEQQLRIHVPFSQVLQIAERPGVPVVIRIMQLVIYKGAVGVSIPMSLG
jgi:hypothetical protein